MCSSLTVLAGSRDPRIMFAFQGTTPKLMKRVRKWNMANWVGVLHQSYD